MLIAFIYGIGYGLLLALMIGPVFFALIRTSISEGFKSGVYLAVGIAMSDAFAASLAYFTAASLGLTEFANNPQFKFILGSVGGTLMIAFGLLPFIKPVSKQKYVASRAIRKTRGIRYILEGALLNLLNPFVYLFWITAVSSVITAYSNSYQHLAFFIGTMVTVLATDIFKSYIADRITNFLNARIIALINKISGIGLISFGIGIIIYSVL